uniref:Uncharacterized protein n=1 Tax=Panagrolaimus sp. JU765 TaxID=591449 RepID=A0AC34RGY6_9BILA
MEEKYENWKQKRQNATLEKYKKYQEEQKRKKQDQILKMKQFISYLLADSLENVIEKIEEMEKNLKKDEVEELQVLENIKIHLENMMNELEYESLTDEEKKKIELKKRIEEAINKTIDDFLHGKQKSKQHSGKLEKNETNSEMDSAVTEFSFTDPKLKDSDSITKEEWEAAKQIFDEQREALKS